jgi:hypothetical protein
LQDYQLSAEIARAHPIKFKESPQNEAQEDRWNAYVHGVETSTSTDKHALPEAVVAKKTKQRTKVAIADKIAKPRKSTDKIAKPAKSRKNTPKAGKSTIAEIPKFPKVGKRSHKAGKSTVAEIPKFPKAGKRSHKAGKSTVAEIPKFPKAGKSTVTKIPKSWSSARGQR